MGSTHWPDRATRTAGNRLEVEPRRPASGNCYPYLVERLTMNKYQVTFSYTVEVETDGDDRDAEDTAYVEFEKLLREYPSASYFVVHDVEEVG